MPEKSNTFDKGRLLKINEKDNVAVALENIGKGERVILQGIVINALEDIDKGHKIAIRCIAPGEDVIKYGFPIGHALKPIATGEYVHTHNIKTNLEGTLGYSYDPGCTGSDRAGGLMGMKSPSDHEGTAGLMVIESPSGCKVTAGTIVTAGTAGTAGHTGLSG